MENKLLLGNQSGFTLLETLIAVTVMLIAFAAILGIQSNSINTTIRARSVTTVAMLLKDEMVQTEYEIQGKSFDEVKKEDAGTFPAPYNADYRWTRVVKEIEFPNLDMASGGGSTSTGTPSNKNGNQEGPNEMLSLVTKLVTQFLSKALREVTVTVYYKTGGKEMSYSATTYWVDLNHEFQLSQ
ncbi:MAG: prepilin-type N-terminal cleavage/methylation domain-containing protein [Bdellovibrionia bacterium]